MLFDAIESALRGTDKEMIIDDMFFGDLAGTLVCHECKNVIQIPDRFMDIPCFVQGNKGVADSIEAYFRDELIEQIICYPCDKDTAMTKG